MTLPQGSGQVHLVVGTAGHIDHGKSALVLALTGTDPDRLKEEKERGITIELGFAHATLGDVSVAFVDVPGHERFVKTMLTGVAGFDGVMLIVAADESVMPQTREHFDICRLLRVPQGVIVMTKADLVDDEMLTLVQLEVRELVAGSFLEGAPVVAVSARSGAGLDELRDLLRTMAARVKRRGSDGAARMPIDRAFSMPGFGTVVTGTVVAGRLRANDELTLAPGGQRVRVRGLQRHGQPGDEVVTGQRAAVNLAGADVASLARGLTLAESGAVSETRRVDVTIELLESAKPLRHGARVRFHQGTSELLGRVSLVGDGGESSEVLKPGGRGLARVRLESVAALTRGDRFILRAYSPPVTIGGGKVLDPDPPRSAVRTTAAGRRFRALDGDESAAVEQMIADAGGEGLPRSALVSRAGLGPADAATLGAALERAARVVPSQDRWFDPAMVMDRSRRLLDVVREFHRQHPLEVGLPREEARERIFGRAHPALFDLVLQRLTTERALHVSDRLALPSHRLALSPEDERLRTAIERSYREGGLKPPDAVALAEVHKVTVAAIEKLSGLLLRQKQLVRLDALVFHREALDGLKEDLQRRKTAAGGEQTSVDVAAFKERYGVSRKFAIPLLEWLDRERVTRRVGDTRIVL